MKAMSYKTRMNGGVESSGIFESASSIVPAKRQNEDQGGSKEAVEGRPPAKKNTDMSNSYRTLDRESEPNGLDRVRQVMLMIALTPSSRWEPCALCGLRNYVASSL